MLTPDMINGLFEAFGALFMLKNIQTLYRDKQIKGVSKLTILFFTGWGYWNCYFYPSLNQPISFVAGACLAMANTIWVCQMVYYSRYKTKAGLA
jgi:hypothetical protein